MGEGTQQASSRTQIGKVGAPAASQGVPLAPALSATAFGAQQMPALPVQVQAQNLLFQQQQAPGAATGGAPKRRRVDSGNSGVPQMAAASTMFNGQQLAEAAVQAMQQGRGRKKSQAQIDRRRERNRILARRTRLRKKFFFESLQKEVLDLQRENEKLKELVRSNIEGEAGSKILKACNAAQKLPPGVLEACGEHTNMESQDFSLVKSIQSSQHSFVITDPSLNDNPIVFASDDFLKVTGYSREEVLGRNCRFLQGTDTNKATVEEIKKKIANGDDVSVTILNYKADGTPFWNRLFIAALRDAQNNIVNFIGVTVRVASPEPGHPDHGKVLTDKPQKSEGANEEAVESTILAIEESVNAAVAAASTGGM